IIQPLSESGHHATAPLRDTGDNRVATTPVDPVVIRQVGSAQHRVAAAICPMTGRAVIDEHLFACMTCRLLGTECQNVVGNIIDLLPKHVSPRHHEGLATTANCGLYLLRLTTPLPGAA